MNSDTPRWMIYVGRIGHLAHGLVFVSIGLISARAAFRQGGGASDSRRAMHTILAQPFGQALLLALIAGLTCYVVWRALEAFGDLEGKGNDAKGLVLRGRSLFVAAVYSGVTVAAIRTLLGAARSGGGGDESARDWTARALQTPFGSWTVALIGGGIIIAGLFQCLRAYRGKFERKLALDEVDPTTRQWLLRLCVFGIAARGVVFVTAGIFLAQAGLGSDPSKARGLSGSLNALQSQPYGSWLFALGAFGLAAFGIYCCVRARYGRVGRS